MAPLDYSNYLSDKGKMALPDGSEQTPSSQVVELPTDSTLLHTVRGLFPLEKHCKVSFVRPEPRLDSADIASQLIGRLATSSSARREAQPGNVPLLVNDLAFEASSRISRLP